MTVPALYVHGDRDGSVRLPGLDQLIANLQYLVPNLTRTVVLPGTGHWTQQESPEEVNAELLKFLSDL
jgi:pimeloyl-ACP methyl ester carboxylesterase